MQSGEEIKIKIIKSRYTQPCGCSILKYHDTINTHHHTQPHNTASQASQQQQQQTGIIAVGQKIHLGRALT